MPFTQILKINLPKSATCDSKTYRNKAFKVSFEADDKVPFAQIIIRGGGAELIFPPEKLKATKGNKYTAEIPANTLSAGTVEIQAEGCTKEDITQSGGGDWIKSFAQLEIKAPAVKKKRIEVSDTKGVKVYFGIHKHMHQPYYRAADTGYWDGMIDGIFGERTGAYTHYVPGAVKQYEGANLPHGALSCSWSGSLIEQLNRAGAEGLVGGAYGNWSDGLREAAQMKTSMGNPRCDFTAFGFFHPLMALIPHRNIVKHLQWHADCIRDTFGVEPSPVLFPPETAFHVRMIPALNEAGVKAVIYDSIHRYRTAVNYPYAGKDEGQLPPNRADQVNPPLDDWLQLQNVWGPSKISPTTLRPEWIVYTDAEGKEHKIIGIPAERYIGNEDARGGYGALQYGDVLGQVYDQVVNTGTFDPKHPPFFLLHSDGDNYGGGTDSYYYNNTGAMIEWLKNDPRFELMSARDYLDKFPPDPANAVHLEPGSWAGADNGDPQFKKWFSMYTEPYSPDLNSWAVLTALQNTVYAVEDAAPDTPGLQEATRYMMTAETSCYWYWTGQQIWDEQVTEATNAALGCIGKVAAELGKGDKTGPTIFHPWVFPENPGGQTWGNNCLQDAEKIGIVNTFIYDISGIKDVKLVLRNEGKESTLAMKDNGPYPTQTSPGAVANYYTCDLPEGIGHVDYYIEATDNNGNTSKSALERVYLA